MKVKAISLPYIFQVMYVLCFTRPRYQVSVYKTIGPLVLVSIGQGQPTLQFMVDQILNSIKGCTSVANLQKKMTLYNTNIDLVKDNVYTKFG